MEENINVQEWGKRFVQVHGRNGMLALAWFLAALFRDIIYEKVHCFPHLFLYGPPATGKSYMGWSLQYMFGKELRHPVDMISANDRLFAQAIKQYALYREIEWIDYSKEANYNRIESLKMAYSGMYNPLCLSGQQAPDDMALRSRSIMLKFDKKELSEEDVKYASELREIEQSGILTKLTEEICSKRDIINDRFLKTLNLVKRDFIWDNRLNYNTIMNYSIVLAVFKILSCELDFGFSYSKLRYLAITNMLTQANEINKLAEKAESHSIPHDPLSFKGMKILVPISGGKTAVFDTEFIASVCPCRFNSGEMGSEIKTKDGSTYASSMSVQEYCLATGEVLDLASGNCDIIKKSI